MRCCWLPPGVWQESGSMKTSEKQTIRRQVRSAFPGQEARLQQSAALCSHVLAWEVYRQTKMVAGYMPMAWEADISPVLLDALACGKTLALPRCEGPGSMTFRQVGSLRELQPGRYGLLEPDDRAKVIPVEQIDLMLVPLEAVTRQGARLGKGGGYYDRVLNRLQGVALGAVLAHQWMEQLPVEKWDIPLTAGADRLGIYLYNEPERTV